MEKQYREYLVGGAPRDKIMGLDPKDKDYTFVFNNISQFKNTMEAFDLMYEIISEKGEIYLSTPSAFTIRYKENLTGELKDVVLARKETYPDPNSRMPLVEIGSLYDDLARRDFCCNAIAEDDCGNLIDPFNGQNDIKEGLIRCPVDAKTSFNDDPLRMLRALRFAITKGFRMNSDINEVISTDINMWDRFARVVKGERIRAELMKMFKHNTIHSMMLLTELDSFSDINILERIFRDDTWLEVTNKKNQKWK